jgi:F-type H+-transporting ATPase subunit b
MPQLDPYWILSQVFWLALSFAALYFVMARVGLPRLGSVLLTRREQIEGDLQVAEAARIQSDVLAQQNEVQIKSARSRAAEVVSEIQKEAEALAVARNADLDKVLHRKMADAQIAINKAKEQVIERVVPVSVELTQEVLKKVTGREVSREIIEKAVANQMRQKHV